jgi:hypothetical protein
MEAHDGIHLSRGGSPVQHWQLPFLGLRTFPADLTAFEIRYFFTFSPKARAAIFSRYGDQHRLASALQIGFLKITGRPLEAFALLLEEVLKPLHHHLGLQRPQPPLRLRDLSGRGQT